MVPADFRRFLLLATCAIALPLASAQSPWTISAPAGCIAMGGTIDVTITAQSMATNQAAAQWHLFWDPAFFALDAGFGIGGIMFQGGWDGIANTMVAGDLYVASWHLTPYPVGLSTQATVRLMHVGGFGTPQLTGSVEIWSDDMLAAIAPPPITMTPANVQISCGALPTCSITNPLGGVLLTGTHLMTFNTTNPAAGNPLNISYEFRDGGAWMPASRVGGGPSMDMGVTPASGLTFNWDINTDFFLPQTGVDFRVTIVDPITMLGNTCQVNVDVDIVNNAPTCNITDPIAGALVVGPSKTIVFDLADVEGNPADIMYQYDKGMGFMPATRMGGGASMDTGVMPGTGKTFIWNVTADAPGVLTGVIFRILLDDLRPGGTGSCQVSFDVRPPNNPPTCNIFFPGAGSTLAMPTQGILFSTTDTDGDPLDITLEYNRGGMGFMLATPTMASSLPNPAMGVPPSGANSFDWDITADIPASSMGVVFRVTVDDGFGGTSSCTKTWNITVPMNPPSCMITSPAGGSTVSASQLITFNAADPDSDPLDIVYEFNAGAGFVAASRVGGGPSMESGVVPAMGLTFDWDIATDIPGSASGVIFRIGVDDGRGGTATCMVTVNVIGSGLCPTIGDCGDCNQDGFITILDSLTAAKIAVSLLTVPPGGVQFNKCNVIGALSPAPAAAVDILDALSLAQIAAGLPVALVCC